MSGGAIFTLGDLLSALFHGTALALLFSAFGSLVFLTLLAPPAMGRMGPADRSLIERRGHALARVSLALAALGELAWLVFEAGVLAGAADPAIVLRALPVVAIKTEFGHLVLAQALALAAALLILGGKRPGLCPILATGLAGFATLLEAWHLHAAAMYGGPSFFLVCETLHVLAAALWLGSLLPLAFFVRAATPMAAFTVAHRYSAFAKPAVLVLAATAFWQGLVLVGSIPALAFTAYGRLVVVKILALHGPDRVRPSPPLPAHACPCRCRPAKCATPAWPKHLRGNRLWRTDRAGGCRAGFTRTSHDGEHAYRLTLVACPRRSLPSATNVRGSAGH